MIGIIFVAFTLRPAITSIGPLTGHIKEDMGITNGLAGLLTTLPLLAFGLLSPFVPKFAQKFGNELSVMVGLIVLGSGIIIRSIDTITLLFSGTIFIGFGIAICNVLLPGVVKQSFPKKVGLVTGVYTLSMAIFAGLGPGLSIPLAESLGLGWQLSLGTWIILIIMAVAFWLPQLRQKSIPKSCLIQKQSNSPIWSSSIAWQVTLFMGLQSMVYFSITSWAPEILLSRGFELAVSGWMITLFQFSGLPANIIIPILADKLPNQKGIALGIGLVGLMGLSGLIFSANKGLLTICMALLGISLGSAISHGLTLISLRAANAEQAANLSGMAQSIGYLLAALGPLMVGLLFDLFHTWTIPLIFLVVITLIFTVAGIGAGRNLYVLQEKHETLST
ncbi:MFS transporter [Cytobacillus depressus]|uniref:MFS transporter n=2 Tax=Cytobacillus depressus TaxID=1602942 RepID=A0A6L3UZQ5_9BACI|nr:MFS transporter [Cytobacillus depressus]